MQNMRTNLGMLQNKEKQLNAAEEKENAEHADGHREECSMDRYRCRPGLSERFGSHWSIWISAEIHMDQSVAALLSGKIRMDQWPWKLIKSYPETGIGPWMALPRVSARKIRKMQKIGKGGFVKGGVGRRESLDGMTKIPSKQHLMLHIWAWSSENLCLEKRKTITMTKFPSRKACYTHAQDPLINLLVIRVSILWTTGCVPAWIWHVRWNPHTFRESHRTTILS